MRLPVAYDNMRLARQESSVLHSSSRSLRLALVVATVGSSAALLLGQGQAFQAMFPQISAQLGHSRAIAGSFSSADKVKSSEAAGFVFGGIVGGLALAVRLGSRRCLRAQRLDTASLDEGRGSLHEPRRATLMPAAIAIASVGVTSANKVLADGGKAYPLANIKGQYTMEDYEDMRDDEERTSKYEKAIQQRLSKGTGKEVVADIGTGPMALLSIMAAKAGAKKVYAIEKEPWVAEEARKAVKSAGLEAKIQVIEADATDTSLPEKVDLVVSELIGNIATGEGVVDIIRDARKRYLKPGKGDKLSTMIPARCETLVAPVAYAYHRLYERGMMSKNRELKLNSLTRDLAFLSDPQVLEAFDSESRGGPGVNDLLEVKDLIFDIYPEAVKSVGEFSGFAFWPRVELNSDLVIDVKGRPSHWPYVVVLTSPSPTPITNSSKVRLTSDVDVSEGTYGKYKFSGKVLA